MLKTVLNGDVPLPKMLNEETTSSAEQVASEREKLQETLEKFRHIRTVEFEANAKSIQGEAKGLKNTYGTVRIQPPRNFLETNSVLIVKIK